MKWLLALCWVWLVFAGRPSFASRTSPGGNERRIPWIAGMIGVRVGVNSIPELERRLGPGLVKTGGHPQGARLWRLRGQPGLIYVDGFDYNASGEAVIDDLTLGSDQDFPRRASDGRHVPPVRAGYNLTALGGRIHLGMSRRAVLRAVRGLLPRPKVTDGSISWTCPGLMHPGPKVTFRTWTLEVYFTGGRVDEIDANAGY